MALLSYSTAVTRHPLFSIAAALVLIVLAIFVHDCCTWLRLPTGPIPLPFLGNTFQLPKSKPWIQFEAWSRKYGPLFTIWVGRKPVLVVSDPQLAVELMEKRSAKYSSRPRMVVMGELYNNYASILVQPYGKAWSTRRRLLHQALSPRALRVFKPTQEAEASRLAYALLSSPEGWEKELERFTSSVVFCVAYGHRIDSLKARVISERFKYMHYMASLNVPGKYLAESLPILAKLPATLLSWKREVQAMGQEEAAANLALLDMVKRKIAQHRANGTSEAVPDSLCKLLLEMRDKEPVPLSEKEFSYIPASLFGAGSDTTASTLCSAFLGLVTHSGVLKSAQAELDRVIGSERSPTFADEARLPYIRALCKEVLRWRPVAVLGGTPHATSEFDVFQGWHIPAGTTILGNSWAINLNKEYYPNPHRFDPIRFLSNEELTALGISKQPYLPSKRHPSNSGHSSFGWGRRICPGADLATNSLYIALAKLLWAYDILPIDGRKYDIFDYTDGFNVRPRSFKCIIQVRSDNHRAVMEKEQGEALHWLEKFTAFEE